MPAQAADVFRLPESRFAQNLSDHLDILLDPARKLEVGDFHRENHPFQAAYRGDLTLELDRGHYWLRFALANDGDKERHAILHVRPSHIAHVELFRHGSNGEIAPVDNEPVIRKPRLFVLTLPPNSQQLFYLRLAGEGSALTSLDLSNLTPFLLSFRTELFANGIGIGVLAILSIANLALFICFPRVRIFLLLGLYAACNLATISASWGYFVVNARTGSPFENVIFLALTHISMALAILISDLFEPVNEAGRRRWARLIQLLFTLNMIAAIAGLKLDDALATTIMFLLVGGSAIIISIRALASYLANQNPLSFSYLFSRIWIILFVTFAALIYHREQASFETINLLLLLGSGMEVLLLSVMSAVHRQRSLLKRFEHQARVNSLEAELRGQSETLRRINRGMLTPLSSIFGMADMLRNSVLTHQQRDYLNTLNGASQELLGIVENLQSYDPLATHPATTPELMFDLHELLDDIAEENRSSGSVIKLSKARSLEQYVVGDPGRLRQLLAQLPKVCRDYQSEPGLTLHAQWQGQLQISLQYKGEKALNLFNAMRGDTSENEEPRAELIARIIIALGGDLRLRSQERRQFIEIKIPLTLWNHEQQLPRPLQLKSRRILIVDPNRRFALQQKKQCEQWGMVAFIAHNSSQAIALHRNQCLLRAPIDILLISDHDGPALCKRIHTDAQEAELPVPACIYLLDNDSHIVDAPLPYRLMSKPSASFTLKRLIVELLTHEVRHTAVSSASADL